MSVSLKNHVWRVVRKPVLGYGFVSLSVALGIYGVVLGWIKSSVLHDRLRVAHITVASSVEAGDWDLAFTNLRANAQAGQLYNLRIRNQDGKIDMIGPLGTYEFGLGGYCAEDFSTPHFRLSGCIRILGKSELYSALFFIALSVLTLGLSFLFFRKTTLQLFDRVAGLLVSENMDQDSGIEEIERVRSRLKSLLGEIEQNSKSQAFAQLTARVAHDIRSPLAVLKMVLEVARAMPDEQKQLVRTAVTRIQDIAANLHVKNREATKKIGREQIATIVESIVAEKTASTGPERCIRFIREYASDAHILFSKVQPCEFGAIISNLLNNAVEAIPDTDGTITVRVFSRNHQLIVEIKDSGKGIPSELLPKLAQRGATFGKEDGSGLGLFNARIMLESWQGRLEIESTVGRGSTVRILLPLLPAPAWLATSIDLTGKEGVVVIDDDSSIRELWATRFSQVHLSTDQLAYLKSPFEALGWVEENADAVRRHMFLVDMDFAGNKMTGLDIIRESGIAENSILVTGRYDDEDVVRDCEQAGVRLCPKPLLGIIPIINIEGQTVCP